MTKEISGGDALTGNTRSHSEHDGKDVSGRWYYAGDGMEEQVAAGMSLDTIPRERVIIYSTLKTAYRRSKDIKEREKFSISQEVLCKEDNALKKKRAESTLR